MIQKVTISLPASTLKKLDKFAAPYKRSQAIHYAVMMALSASEKDRYEYWAAFKALCRG